ncbi:MAG TPA: hypothetical protein VEA78_10580 [Acidimicrobiales bacterium]|nr:hypothetical protein [Acidimicrobiales bacterium]
MSPSDLRRRRQLEQLRDLCRRGAVVRAIDLAFEHFACFGQDDDVVVLLEAVVSRTGGDRELGTRLAELRAVRR